jgi:hypothetical protein
VEVATRRTLVGEGAVRPTVSNSCGAAEAVRAAPAPDVPAGAAFAESDSLTGLDSGCPSAPAAWS